MRQHEAEIDRQQRLELAGSRVGRIFADAENAAEGAAIGVADLDRLAAEDDALAVEGTAEMAPDDGHASMPACHHHFADFHRLGEFDAVVPIDRQAARGAALHQLFEIARLVLQPLQQIGIDRIGFRVGPGLVLEELHQLVGAVDGGAQHQGHEEAVDEHPLLVHPREIGGVEIAREA